MKINKEELDRLQDHFVRMKEYKGYKINTDNCEALFEAYIESKSEEDLQQLIQLLK